MDFAERTLRSRVGGAGWVISPNSSAFSDVALKKCCQRSAIPTPERGYWARKDAGKETYVPALPERPPAMEEDVVVGAGNSYSYWYGPELSRGELFGPLPSPP